MSREFLYPYPRRKKFNHRYREDKNRIINQQELINRFLDIAKSSGSEHIHFLEKTSFPRFLGKTLESHSFVQDIEVDDRSKYLKNMLGTGVYSVEVIIDNYESLPINKQNIAELKLTLKKNKDSMLHLNMSGYGPELTSFNVRHEGSENIYGGYEEAIKASREVLTILTAKSKEDSNK